ncbi:adenylate/guanylate cyclase domain-containing protein [Psychrobacter urativorans]|uniref:adenylate/guanylate cyclase domain-containing protein n=1 Tax=Psychrobacter urativorans TaxID=45610 RepID=UPI001917C0F6|nr:adenylate/guanylate cyclase domain-containing protein [Psychrobacter urativorans]
MSNLESLFQNYYEQINNKHSSLTKNESLEAYDSLTESLTLGPQAEFLLQAQIRPHFGKKGVNNSPIGTHPDFIALESTRATQNHYACTLFVDIKGSTRLSLLYDLDFVFKFKNTVIQACVEIIRSFDGHVHRLMGDAVMAFFGGSSTEKEDAIADAINCSITLRAILEESIKPWMEKQGLEAKDFGFRVGCDFGDNHEVIWGSFGYQNVGEVSAAGLPVDMASKLQGLARKNETMLGQGLLDYVNWPEKYSNIKTRVKNNSVENLPIVTPNLTYKDNSSLNYKMRQLSYLNCLEFSALPRDFRERISGSQIKANSHIEYKCFSIVDEEKKEYISSSRFLDPDISLVFEVQAQTANRLLFPLKVCFTKTNHGVATPIEERDIEQKNLSGTYKRNDLINIVVQLLHYRK